MNASGLRNTLNFYNGKTRVIIRVGRKEYDVDKLELKYITTQDLDDPKEEQVVVIVAQEE